uniref:Uncharacterized protein n=1 Tax=Rhizophora mucronata TaxID=61149 RepID=A0A2P2PQD8_RHIMU
MMEMKDQKKEINSSMPKITIFRAYK